MHLGITADKSRSFESTSKPVGKETTCAFPNLL